MAITLLTAITKAPLLVELIGVATPVVPHERTTEGVFGNIGQKLVKTRMANSVLDSGWSTLERMLQYKGEHAGVYWGTPFIPG
jgi:hypothetical protein